jgi:uncharacterized alpha-E superfamily protein
MRTTRTIVPREAWETLNDLRAFAHENVQAGLTRRGRYAYLSQVVGRCQQITGNMVGTMSHDKAYNFVCMGRNLERADMGVRILDVRAHSLLPGRLGELRPFNDIQWKSVLMSLSSYQNYRRQVHVRVKGDAVLGFLLQDERSPRSVGYCLSEIEACLRDLPRNEAPLRVLGQIQRRVKEADVRSLVEENLHPFLDELQDVLAELHEAVRATYFELEQPETTGPLSATG